MSDSEGRGMETRSIDQKKARRKCLVVLDARIASFLRLLNRPLQEVIGWLRPLATRMLFVIFELLQSSLNFRPN